MEILIFLFFINFLFLTLRRLDLAVSFIIVFLPSYLIRFSILTIPVTILELMILTAFFVWFFKEGPNLKDVLKNRNKRINYPFWREIILILISAFISLIVAGFSNVALGIFKAYFLEAILFYILVINVFKGDKGRNKIFNSFIYLSLLVSIVAVYQKITGHFIPNIFWSNFETRRVVSWFSYPNAVGLLLGPISVLLLAYYHSLAKKTDLKGVFKKIMIIFSIVLSVLSIYFAKSEGALIAVLISFLLFFIILNKTSRKISFLIISLFIVLFFTYLPFKNFTLNKVSLNDLSGQIRIQQWKETIQTFKGKNIILGNGLGSYKNAVSNYHQEGIFYNFDNLENFDAIVWASPELQKKYWQPVEIYLYPHNIFLNFWSELGLLGLIAFMFILFRSLYISFNLYYKNRVKNKKKSYIALGIFMAVLVMLIHGLVDVPYFKNDLSVFFFVIIAILGGLMIDNKKNI